MKTKNNFVNQKMQHPKHISVCREKFCPSCRSGFKHFGAVLLVVVFTGFLLNVSGQGRNQEVTIVAPYQPSITDASKLPINPELLEMKSDVPEIEFSIISQPIPTSYEIQPLKPIFLQVDPEKKMRRNFLKAGFGNYTMPYAEFFSNSLQSDKFSLGFHVRHLSSKGELKDHPVSAFSQNRAALYGKRYLRNNVLSADLYYERNLVHYYGFDPDEDTALLAIPDDELRQRFSLIGAEFGLGSNHNRRNRPNYKVDMNFHHLQDLYQTNETAIGLITNLNTTNKVMGFSDDEEFGADLTATFFNNSDSLQSQANFMAGLKPYLSLNFEYLDLTIGAEAAIAADSASDFYVYPNVKAFFKVIPDHLRVYFTATGGLSRNSLRSTSTENPWLNSIFPFGFTSTKYDFKGGATGKINLLLDFNFSVSYAEVENMLFFVNDYFTGFSPMISENFGNKFTGVYDDAKVTTISVEVGYEQTERLNALLMASYREYELSVEEHPWHKPSFEASLMTKYFISPQLSATGELFFSGKRNIKIPEGNGFKAATLKAYLDLNLGATYSFSDKVAAFARVNNLTASRYYRWHLYPSQRINVMGGLTFAF
jgi:hypothetical protein